MKDKAVKYLLFRPKKFTTLVMMLIIWAGAASTVFVGVSTDVKNRNYLLGRVQIAGNSLSAEQIRDLRGSNDDLASLNYTRLHDHLRQIRASNTDLRYAYLLQFKNNHVQYAVDAENSSSPEYVTPGTVYQHPPDDLINAFKTPKAFVDGPRSSTRGLVVSAYSPIWDPSTGKIVAVVGIDTTASSFYTQVILYAMVPLILTAIPLIRFIRDIKIQSKEQEIMLLKNQFVSIASHELRSPLTGMLWAVQSLSRSGASRLNLEQLSMLGAMYHSAESSLATVNEILDFSIFERGQAKIQREQTDVAAVIKQVVATLSLSAREKHLVIEPIGKWPRQVQTIGDVSALKRGFMNIFSNAIKYSNDNTAIHITYKDGSTDHIIGVRDHGIGIPKEEQAKVLDGYYRATNATHLSAHGTGLGLMATRKIIEQHGGRLWLESEQNMGTTVYISLPKAGEGTGDTIASA